MEGRSIVEIFEGVFSNSDHNLKVAEEEFRELVKADPDVKRIYQEWCDEMGYTERKGFKSYFINKSESDDNIWDTIFPNSEELDGYEFH